MADSYRAARRRGKYQQLATDTEVNSCFRLFLNSELHTCFYIRAFSMRTFRLRLTKHFKSVVRTYLG